MSFLSRLAARQGSLNAAEFCFDVGLNYGGIHRGESPALEDLATLGAADLGALQNNSIRFETTARIFRGERLNKYNFVKEKVRVCPYCLAKDIENFSYIPPDLAMHGRTLWLIRPINTCVIHSCRLLDIGRHSRGEYLLDFASFVFNREIDPKNLITLAIDQTPTPFEEYLVARLAGSLGGEWIDCLPLHAACRVAEVLGCAKQHGPRPNMPTEIEARRQLSQIGYEILAGGEASIRRFLNEMYATYHRHGRRVTGPKSAFGTLWSWACDDLPKDDFSSFRAIFTEVLIDTYPYGPGDELFGYAVQRRKLHSVRSVSRDSGLHPKTARKMLFEAGLLCSASDQLTDAAATCLAADAEQIIRDGPSALSLEEVERRYNLPRPHKYMLHAEGYIRPLFERRGKGGGLNLYFATTEIDGFFMRLLKDATDVSRPDVTHLTIPYAAKKACTSAKAIIDLILDQKLTWVGRHVGVMGFPSILVDLNEIRRLTEGPALSGFTKIEAERHLVVSYRSFNRLLGLGLIKTARKPSPINKCPQTIIPRSSVRQFDRTFVTIGRLSRDSGLHMNRLKKLLGDAGVAPAFDRVAHGVTVYRREQIPANLCKP